MTQVNTNVFAAPPVTTLDPLTPGARESIAGIRQGSLGIAELQTRAGIAAGKQAVDREGIESQTKIANLQLDFEKARVKMENFQRESEFNALEKFRAEELEFKKTEAAEKARLKGGEIDVLRENTESSRRNAELERSDRRATALYEAEFNALTSERASTQEAFDRAIAAGNSENRRANSESLAKIDRKMAKTSLSMEAFERVVKDGPAAALTALEVAKDLSEKNLKAEADMLEKAEGDVPNAVMKKVQLRQAGASRGEGVFVAITDAMRDFDRWMYGLFHGQETPQTLETFSHTAFLDKGGKGAGTSVFNEIERNSLDPRVLLSDALEAMTEEGLVTQEWVAQASPYLEDRLRLAWDESVTNGRFMDENARTALEASLKESKTDLMQDSMTPRAFHLLAQTTKGLASQISTVGGDEGSSDGRVILSGLFEGFADNLDQGHLSGSERSDMLGGLLAQTRAAVASRSIEDDVSTEESWQKYFEEQRDASGVVPEAAIKAYENFQKELKSFTGARTRVEEEADILDRLRSEKADLSQLSVQQQEEVALRVGKMFEGDFEKIRKGFAEVGIRFEPDEEEEGSE